MAKEKFYVEGTVNVEFDDGVNPRDREAVREWLTRLFHHHDRDFTVHRRDRSVVARVQMALELDLSLATGETLSEQLKSLHKLAVAKFAETFQIDRDQVWELDVLVSDM
jgi:hypothetical protein